MYLGWELIGLTSFFLINFWSTKVLALKSAFKAFTFNKISDVSILLSILLVFSLINDVNTLVLNKEIAFYTDSSINLLGYSVNYIELLSFFLLSAAFIKSAQFGFHIWLPDSMEAPVPASALIHSATLVSAGIYLLLRLSPIFQLSQFAFYVIPTMGALTAAFGGVCAAYQSDIKKILAYSTISHCGFLMVSFTTGYIEYTLLYLYVHGFFKAAVFLCVGNVIRFSRNYQDFRRMGLFYKYLPFECVCSFICLINLSGLPFTLGFYIKHVLILGLPDTMLSTIYILLSIGALSGIVYSFRLFYNVFFDFKKAKKPVYLDALQENLKSKFYSNTSVASSLSILGIILFSYGIIIYFYNLLLNDLSFKSDINHLWFSVSSQLNYYTPTESFKKNIFFINYLVLFTALLVYLVKWRKTYNYSSFYIQFLIFVNVSVFMYMFIIII
jgi:NADH:ubiquinone oxidoreductase subunit 5 (subunit L)/multisubunit Na+/H+ antiporter MnhA subunit